MESPESSSQAKYLSFIGILQKVGHTLVAWKSANSHLMNTCVLRDGASMPGLRRRCRIDQEITSRTMTGCGSRKGPTAS